jgi:citrate lyase subunit beta/citryl-CoA lyase
VSLSSVSDATTLLFVPGSRPDRFAKAAESTADGIIIDLEDAVADTDADVALAHTVDALSSGTVSAIVRVRAASDVRHATQVRSLAHLPGLIGIMVAKADDEGTLQEIAQLVPEHVAIVPLVESAVGLSRCENLAAVPGVSRLAFGSIDYSLDIGAEHAAAPMAYARSRLVNASRAAGIRPPLDAPSVEISNTAAVEDQARRARAFGFGGMLAIHPGQLSAIRSGFAPTDAELTWARRVLSADGASAQVAGQFVDLPVAERARWTLSRAENSA